MASVSFRGQVGRLLLALGGLISTLGVAELSLRAHYATLPSLSAVADRPELVEPFRVAAHQRRRGALDCDQVIRDPRGHDRVVGEGSPARTLWFAGTP